MEVLRIHFEEVWRLLRVSAGDIVEGSSGDIVRLTLTD